MPPTATKQEWLDYAEKLSHYNEEIQTYAQNYNDDGENPLPPLPPKPPAFTGFEGE